MKSKIIPLILTLTLPTLITSHLNQKNDIYLSKTINTNNILKQNNNYKMNINYPITNSGLLNKEIEKIINNYKLQFNNDLKDLPNNPNYQLDINYKDYKYNNYISYIFYIESDLGGAHPSHQIRTINYNTKENKVITIDNIIKYNSNVLNALSNLSRENLKKLKIFKSNDINEMMINGTSPTKNNFKNFVFTQNGLMIIFERYQIAPYFFGEYNITIPYNKLKNIYKN